MKFWLTTLLLLCAALPERAMACAVCFGDPTSPAAKGLAMGVIVLLGVVLAVLGGFTAFFIYLARRSATMQSESLSAPTNQV